MAEALTLILSHLIATIIWGSVGLAVVVFSCVRPVRERVLLFVGIELKKAHKATSSPIERELALIAGPQRTIEEASQQVQDLRGQRLHEGNLLLLRNDDLRRAEEAYYKANDEGAEASAIEEALGLVADKEQEITIQQGVVDGLDHAVAASCGAVVRARRELRSLELKVKSDEAKARATEVSENAAKVIEAAKAIGVTGGALQQESDTVHENYEQARVRLDEADGTPAEREFKSAKRKEELSELRKRLDAQRSQRPAGQAS
jgi:uncharacterized coiled-coil protein SlyX